jgi:hypothetical protein
MTGKEGGGKRCARDCWRIRDPALLASARQRTKDTAQKLLPDLLDQNSGAKRSTASPGGFVYLGDDDVDEFVVGRFFLIQDRR